jgi:glycerol kinase
MRYVLTMDAGTTGVRALLVDREGAVAADASREFRQMYPEPGWHEQSAPEIWQCQLEVARKVLAEAQASAKDVAAIGITNQRETSTIWSRRTGEPVYHAINWGDRRVAPIIESIRERGLADAIRLKCGVVPDATFSAAKIMWLLDNMPGAREGAESGELVWGTVDTWLLWNLTGGTVHATDPSNASRTMMFDIRTLEWDEGLLREFNIPRALLPEVKPTSGFLGETVADLFGAEIPVAAVAGDQQAALFGQACFEPGMAKNTFGTAGCFDMNAGDKVRLVEGMATNVAWQLADKVEYTVAGVALVSGAVVQWLRDEMQMVTSADETAALAAEVEDTGGVYLVPAMQGLNAPYWDMYARGVMIGFTRATRRAHVVRAALESMAYQTRDIIEATEAPGDLKVTELRIDGGAAKNEVMCQFLADILGIPVVKPPYLEATAYGAAYLAGLAVGFWADQADISDKWKVERIYEPRMGAARREELYAGWKKAVGKCLGWLRD